MKGEAFAVCEGGFCEIREAGSGLIAICLSGFLPEGRGKIERGKGTVALEKGGRIHQIPGEKKKGEETISRKTVPIRGRTLQAFELRGGKRLFVHPFKKDQPEKKCIIFERRRVLKSLLASGRLHFRGGEGLILADEGMLSLEELRTKKEEFRTRVWT